MLIALVMLSCSKVPITGRSQLNLVGDKEVLSMSLQSYTEYMKTAKVSSDQANTALVQKVGRRMATAVEEYLKSHGMAGEIKNYNWSFALVEDKTPNAFCMPGGKVVVNTGILPITRDETGLAVVLGHEIAHAVAKHGNERMSQQMVANAGGAILGIATMNKSQETQQLLGTLYGAGAQVGVMLPYSRSHELEADKMGLIFMAMAGYDVNGAVSFWERMKASTGAGTAEFLSTHPSDSRRISEIKKNIPEALKYYTKQ